MKPKEKKSFLAETPSAILAILTAFGGIIILFGVGEGLASLLKIMGDAGEVLPYILYGIFIAFCCFFIVRQNPGSIWYVPVISNILGIISAIVEPNFWITSMWILICSGWVLSIIASISGALIRKEKAVSKSQAALK